jgi:hypothetical protein
VFQSWGGQPADKAKEKPRFSAYLLGQARPLPGLPDLEVPVREAPAERQGRRGAVLLRDQRVHLIPEAKLAVLLPAEDDRLVLQRYDVYAALEKSEAHYLFMTSQPPLSVRKGQTYTYPLAVRASKGGVKFFLKSGPQGMSVSEQGLVTWAVPAEFDESEVEAVLSVSDAGGQKVSQAFTLRLAD